MNYFYLKVCLLICFIFAISYFNTYMNSNPIRETFSSNNPFISNNNRTFVLLGDSILKNNAYASDGKGIDDLLLERNKQTYSYAVDNSNIVDVYNQINEIPIDLNTPSTTIFLSAGGNDILNHYHESGGDIHDTSVLSTIFAAYKKMIKSIRAKMNQCKIVILDIYYPDNTKYTQYHPIISEWNKLIYDYADQQSNNINTVLRVSGMLTQNDDFTLSIEPSSSGGLKIADSILNSY
jgi:lysophospholipase L1-like esterase